MDLLKHLSRPFLEVKILWILSLESCRGGRPGLSISYMAIIELGRGCGWHSRRWKLIFSADLWNKRLIVKNKIDVNNGVGLVCLKLKQWPFEQVGKSKNSLLIKHAETKQSLTLKGQQFSQKQDLSLIRIYRFINLNEITISCFI